MTSIYETYKKDSPNRHTHENCLMTPTKRLTQETRKRKLQNESTKETYRRDNRYMKDSQNRHTHENCLMRLTKRLAQETRKRKLQKESKKETYKRDNRHTKERYKKKHI